MGQFIKDFKIYFYKKRKPYIEKGDLLPSHPYAKIAFIFFVLALVSLISTMAIGLSGKELSDGWLFMCANGMACSIISFSIISIIFASFAIVSSIKERKYGKSLAIVVLLANLFVLTLYYSIVNPAFLYINNGLIEVWQESRLNRIGR